MEATLSHDLSRVEQSLRRSGNTDEIELQILTEYGEFAYTAKKHNTIGHVAANVIPRPETQLTQAFTRLKAADDTLPRQELRGVYSFGGEKLSWWDTLAESGIESGARLTYNDDGKFYHFYFEEGDAKPSVIIDNGGYNIKAGFSGDDTPQTSLSTVVGYPKQKICGGCGTDKDFYVGEEAQMKRCILILKYPVESGIVQNWGDMEKVWRNTFEEQLRAVIGDENEEDEDCHGVLLTESPTNPAGNRERTTQSMFETFNARRFYLANTAVLSIYGTGRTTGLAIDCGNDMCHTVPVFQGSSVPGAVQRVCRGGRYLDDFLCNSLQSNKIVLTTTAERESARKIKEDLCYVSMNFSEEYDNFQGKERQFEMPDKTIVTVHNQLILCPEVLFQPSLRGTQFSMLGGSKMQALHEIARRSVQGCHPDIHQALLGNTVMSGGTSKFPNMPERMQSELQNLFHERVNMVAPPERDISTWIGGSVLASLSTFSHMWIDQHSTVEMPSGSGACYDEMGPRIVHMMCCQ